MFTVDLKKELETIPPSLTEKEIQEKLLIQDIQKILEDKSNYDQLIYDRLGWGDHILKGEIIQQKYIDKAKAIKNLDTKRVFTKTQIKKLCCSYYLRFLPSKLFKGNIDPTIPGHIKTFEKELGKKVTDFYVAAPVSSFKLEKSPVDPLLFAQIEDDLYYLVHKWGNDINIFRKLFFFTQTYIGLLITLISAFALLGWTINSFVNMSGLIAYCVISTIITLGIITKVSTISSHWDDNYEKSNEETELWL